VLLAGPVDSPRVLDRRRIELSDPSIPHTIQPYHAGLHAERTDAGMLEKLARLVARRTQQELAELVRAYRSMGHQPTRIGIVVGSIIDPANDRQPTYSGPCPGRPALSHRRRDGGEGARHRLRGTGRTRALRDGGPHARRLAGSTTTCCHRPGTHRRPSLGGHGEDGGRGGVACPDGPLVRSLR
jgi:hypothetical protein